LTAEILIRTEGLEKVYNPGMPDELTALHGVSIEIEKDKVTVLKGPSGSGKTSLLSLIGCMSRPTAGRIFVDGKDVVKLPERFLTNIRRERFGFIFQQLHLIRNVSVLENILLPLYPLSMGASSMQKRALVIMKKLKIEEKHHFKVKQLSGGEQQRVAIARAIINDPEVIIADEPTAHLDMKLAEEFMDILGTLSGEGKTIVIATHDPFVHEHPLVSKTIAMRDGRVEKVAVR
jgi:putative ABC transport system ATP-binding protein